MNSINNMTFSNNETNATNMKMTQSMVNTNNNNNNNVNIN